MKRESIIAEVRRVRHQIAKECGYDLDRILEHANESARRFEDWKNRTRAAG